MNSTQKILLVLILIITGTSGLIFYLHPELNENFRNASWQTSMQKRIFGEFHDNFERTEILKETALSSESDNASWWLSSGGEMVVEGSLAKTLQQNLSVDNYWYSRYKSNNPTDTDGGLHPQNIFRLVTKEKWKNYTQQIYFMVNKDNLSQSSNRNSSNGIFLFNRYQDENNLYYTGLRVDGRVIIKKKVNGYYYTMANKVVLKGLDYNYESNPNLIPKNIWIGLKSETINNLNKSVKIRLMMDLGRQNRWQTVLEVEDDGRSFGGPAIRKEGNAGIRTDFMDVQFDDYRIYRSNLF